MNRNQIKRPPKIEFKGFNPDGVFVKGTAKKVDDIKDVGSFFLVVRDIEDSGLPPMSFGDVALSFLEAQLVVTSLKTRKNQGDEDRLGQILTVCNSVNGTPSTYSRMWADGDDGGKWLPWQLQVTGDISVVAPSNELGEKISLLESNVASEVSRAKDAEAELATDIDKLKAYRDYAVITNQYPSMSTSKMQFTVPAGATIYSNRSKGAVTLVDNIVYGLHNGAGYVYCILDVVTLASRTASVNTQNFVLGENEVILAYVNMYIGVMCGLFSKYTLNGNEVKLIQTTSLDTHFSDYAVLTGGTPSMDTTNKTFTIPKIYISAREKGMILLTEEIVITQTDTSWSTQYIVLDLSTKITRTVNSSSSLKLNANEVVIALVRWGNGVIDGNFLKYFLNGKEIELKPQTSIIDISAKIDNEVTRAKAAEQAIADAIAEITGTTSVISPKMYNPPLNIQKTKIRVLDIGNSYTGDAMHYLGNICTAFDYITGYSVYAAKRGGASFKSWVDTYNDADNLSYSVTSCVGDKISEITEGTGQACDGSIFRDALKNGKWDLIIIHQLSNYSTNFDNWESESEAGYLKELIQILRETNPQAAIGTYLIHSYRSSYSGNSEKSSLERWEKMATATKKFCFNYGIDFVIPYGTAVQNLRATSLSDENEFSTDGTHLADGLGDYVAACCYWQSLFAPRTGISIIGNTYRKTDLDESVIGVLNITDETAPIAQKAAMWAAYNWYEVKSPE